MYTLKSWLIPLLPTPLLSLYHFVLAFCAALLNGFPSRRIIVVGVTGTKGKSSTVEYLNAIFEGAGWKTALSSTIRFKIGSDSQENKKRMTIPGRFFLQEFIADSVRAGCKILFVELTSEGARQYRHRFLELDALLFLNLSPEHIESHGSLQAYADAKFELGLQLARSKKRPRFLVVNADDKESGRYLGLPVETILPFSLSGATPFATSEKDGFFTLNGAKIEVKFPGEFSLKNALAAATLAEALGIDTQTIAHGVSSLTLVRGRAEEVREGQPYTAVIDYAHTPDSLRAIYEAYGERRKICVLGSTGGGRDMWKRPVMGGIAEHYCDAIILTNEDPYDEDPRAIIDMIAHGMRSKKPEIIIDRREAMRHAFSIAKPNDVVIVTGKGTDPTIESARGTRIPWDDATVAREEIRKLLERT